MSVGRVIFHDHRIPLPGYDMFGVGYCVTSPSRSDDGVALAARAAVWHSSHEVFDGDNLEVAAECRIKHGRRAAVCPQASQQPVDSFAGDASIVCQYGKAERIASVTRQIKPALLGGIQQHAVRHNRLDMAGHAPSSLRIACSVGWWSACKRVGCVMRSIIRTRNRPVSSRSVIVGTRKTLSGFLRFKEG